MPRILTTCVVAAAVMTMCSHAQSRKQTEGRPHIDVTELQQQRIKLLAERVSQSQALFATGLRDVTDVARAQIDLLVIQIEYAVSTAAKKKLYTDLLQKYDVQIDAASQQSKAPPRPVQPGQRLHPQLEATLRLLQLKSERIRVQIELESLR